MNKKQKNLPLILIILDGWGLAEPNKGNAVTLAKTPVMDKLYKNYPWTEICAHGKCVGLPKNQVGNSEAGHMNIGAGRIIEQDAVRINKSIDDMTFFKNPAFLTAINHVKEYKSSMHLMGMLSNGASPHSDPKHLQSILLLLRQKKIEKIYLHLFTDGRDSGRFIGLKLAQQLTKSLMPNEKIASVMGRFYAMDRKKAWPRTEKAYNAIVLGQGRKAKTVQDAITQGYNHNENDEFLNPYIITENNQPIATVKDNDSVIFFNLRSDRARQLAKTFIQIDFEKKNPNSFRRKKVLKNLSFVAMTDFGPDLEKMITAYPSKNIKQTLPMQLKNISQLYLAETEKYAHVTYFFNGGYADPVNGEDRKVVPSPNVKSYDLTPAMSSGQLTKEVLTNLEKGKYDFTVLNFAAPDMVGHTGNLKAGIQTIEAVDKYVGEIVRAYLKKNGIVIITADHGNIEEMINLETGEVDTKHSTNPVPFIIVGKEFKNKKIKFKKNGLLGDVAPTILKILGYKKPKEMIRSSLI